jgi:hypothetical protein
LTLYLALQHLANRSESSSAKKLIMPVRNKLEDTTIEAAEYLKAWFNKGLIQREEDVF